MVHPYIPLKNIGIQADRIQRRTNGSAFSGLFGEKDRIQRRKGRNKLE
jgi:hypothetical protein